MVRGLRFGSRNVYCCPAALLAHPYYDVGPSREEGAPKPAHLLCQQHRADSRVETISWPFCDFHFGTAEKLNCRSAHYSTVLQSAPRSTLHAYDVVPVKRRTCRSTKLQRLQILNARRAWLAARSIRRTRLAPLSSAASRCGCVYLDADIASASAPSRGEKASPGRGSKVFRGI